MIHLCQSGHMSFSNEPCVTCGAPIAWSGPFATELEFDTSEGEVFSESEMANGSRDRFYSSIRFKIPDE
jgi:hypothetical protein